MIGKPRMDGGDRAGDQDGRTDAMNWLKELSPSYFAMSMATGIVSIGCQVLGLRPLAVALFAVDVAAYLALWVLSLLRVALFPRSMLADLASHQRGIGFLTVVAATGVLGADVIALFPVLGRGLPDRHVHGGHLSDDRSAGPPLSRARPQGLSRLRPLRLARHLHRPAADPGARARRGDREPRPTGTVTWRPSRPGRAVRPGICCFYTSNV